MSHSRPGSDLYYHKTMVAELGAGSPASRIPFAPTRDQLIGYALVLPAALLVLGLLVYPVTYDAWLSLTDAVHFSAPANYVGLRNYREVFADKGFWEAARNTAFLVGVTVLVELVVGVLTALLLWWRFWGRAVVFVAVFVPWAFPAAFSAFAWYWLLMPPFHSFYTLQVLEARWWLEGIFGMGAWQVLSIGVMSVWRGSSIIAIFLLAAFNAIPEELLDYGKLEARSPWQYFWRVVAPLARRFLILAVLVAVVITYTEYVSMYVETGGRIIVPVIGTLAFIEAIYKGNTGLGAALSLIQLPVAIALAVACLRLVESPAGGRRRAARAAEAPPIRAALAGRPPAGRAPAGAVPRRRWRLRRLTLTAAGMVAAWGVMGFHLFPVYYTAVQAFRSVKEYALGNPFWIYRPDFGPIDEVIHDPTFWRWSWNTLVIFGVVLLVGLTVSLLAGYALARLDPPGGRWLVRLMFLTYFLPQMAVIVPMYQLFLRWDLDDTVLGIVLLYLTLAIPFPTWLFFTYFQGLTPEVEEQALLDGNRVQVFLRVALPMSWPVVIAAGLFTIGMMGSDVLYATTFAFSNATKTLPAGLGLIAVELDEWAPSNGAMLLSSLPIIAACAGLSPYFLRGLRAALHEGA
jgi:multiple sugar transport system permease protein